MQTNADRVFTLLDAPKDRNRMQHRINALSPASLNNASVYEILSCLRHINVISSPCHKSQKSQI
jgi:hypothetical protein